MLIAGSKTTSGVSGGVGSLNSLLYGNGTNSGAYAGTYSHGGGASGQNQTSVATQGNQDGSNSNLRKKRRRKRSKGNRQRIKSFLSSSSGAEDQMNESMIESCSSPDYSRQETELGKDIFFDF